MAKSLPSIPSTMLRNTFRVPGALAPLDEITPAPMMFDISNSTDSAKNHIISELIERNNWMGAELIALRNQATSSSAPRDLKAKKVNRLSMNADQHWAEASTIYPDAWLSTLRAFKVEHETTKGKLLDLTRQLALSESTSSIYESNASEAKAFTDLLMTRTIDAESVVISQIKRIDKTLSLSRAETRTLVEKLTALNQSLVEQAMYTIKAEAEVEALKAGLATLQSASDFAEFNLDQVNSSNVMLSDRLDSKIKLIEAQTQSLKQSDVELRKLKLAVGDLNLENEILSGKIVQLEKKPSLNEGSQTDEPNTTDAYAETESLSAAEIQTHSLNIPVIRENDFPTKETIDVSSQTDETSQLKTNPTEHSESNATLSDESIQKAEPIEYFETPHDLETSQSSDRTTLTQDIIVKALLVDSETSTETPKYASTMMQTDMEDIMNIQTNPSSFQIGESEELEFVTSSRVKRADRQRKTLSGSNPYKFDTPLQTSPLISEFDPQCSDSTVLVSKENIELGTNELTELRAELARVNAEYTFHKSNFTLNPKAMEYFKLRDSNEQLKKQLEEFQRRR